jgi:serine protease Do
VQDLSAAEVQDLGIDGGVRVADVVPGSPASKAGLRQGDIITGVNRGRILRASTLRWRVGSETVGHRLTFRVRREGRLVRVPVRLRATPPEEALPLRAEVAPESPPNPRPAPTPSHG